MRGTLYLALCERLSDMFQHIDLWNSNIQFITEEQAWECPACFIEFEPINWKLLGNGVEQAIVGVKLHIVTRCIAPGSAGSPYQEDAIAYFDLLDQLNARLHRFSGACFGFFQRKQSVTNANHAELIESVERYEVAVMDNSAVEMYEATQLMLNLSKLQTT